MGLSRGRVLIIKLAQIFFRPGTQYTIHILGLILKQCEKKYI